MFRNLKSNLVSAFLLGALAVSLSWGVARYVTSFDKIQLNQNAILDSSGTQRISVGTTNAITGNLTVSGTTAVTGAQTFTGAVSGSTITVSSLLGLPRSAAPRTNITPTAVGQLIYNTADDQLCVSTGTTKYTWAILNSTANVCLH